MEGQEILYTCVRSLLLSFLLMHLCSFSQRKLQAQVEWAGLTIDATAELFVFVCRWSNQKGLDLNVEAFPAALEKHSKAQLICIGPVIDLDGKFAALKLGEMMKKYPGRVCSKQ